MIKKIAWDTFKNTGNINTYLELKQIEKIEDGIEEKSSKITQITTGQNTLLENQHTKNEEDVKWQM